ncbi:hypothetical protein PS1_007138 [Malus domestica]
MNLTVILMMILPYTVYALAGQELSAMQFRLVQAMSLVSCSLGSCGQGAFGAVLQFQLVQGKSVSVAFYARADKECCAMQFRLVRTRSFGSCSLGSCEQGTLVRAV